MNMENKKGGFWKMALGFMLIIILGLVLMGVVSWYESGAEGAVSLLT